MRTNYTTPSEPVTPCSASPATILLSPLTRFFNPLTRFFNHLTRLLFQWFSDIQPLVVLMVANHWNSSLTMFFILLVSRLDRTHQVAWLESTDYCIDQHGFWFNWVKANYQFGWTRWLGWRAQTTSSWGTTSLTSLGWKVRHTDGKVRHTGCRKYR